MPTTPGPPSLTVGHAAKVMLDSISTRPFWLSWRGPYLDLVHLSLFFLFFRLCFSHSRFGEKPRSLYVAAMVPLSGYGRWEPRHRGDLRRASERAALLVFDARPVQPRTKDNRDYLIQKFDAWLQITGESVKSLIDSADTLTK